MNANPSLCPVCENVREEGEYVDNGIGYEKCSPDYCLYCGWCESSAYVDNSGGFTDEQRRKLWELQVPVDEVFQPKGGS